MREYTWYSQDTTRGDPPNPERRTTGQLGPLERLLAQPLALSTLLLVFLLALGRRVGQVRGDQLVDARAEAGLEIASGKRSDRYAPAL